MADFATDLVAGQIVRLTHGQTHLYATVIQVLEERPMAWLRPLLLVQGEVVHPLNLVELTGAWSPSTAPIPDMVWPIAPLTPALDTEVLPLLSALAAGGAGKARVDMAAADAAPARTLLRALVQNLWAETQRPGAGA